MTAEHDRLKECSQQQSNRKKWGPYLSERKWGTVREDYSENGDAWNFFTHDHARSRAYRWGEDGLAGISDDQQQLCFALALWNGKDPIIKERLFGLTNNEGNHGEDVKVAATHSQLGEFTLSCDSDVPLLFTENETNHERLFPGKDQKNESPYVKDGINDYVVQGNQNAVNPAKQETKVAAHLQVNVGAGQTTVIRLRLSRTAADKKDKPFGRPFDNVFANRLFEADAFYKSVTPPSVSADAANADNGAGLGASHQTGWTGLVAKFIQLYCALDAKPLLEGGKMSAFRSEKQGVETALPQDSV